MHMTYPKCVKSDPKHLQVLTEKVEQRLVAVFVILPNIFIGEVTTRLVSVTRTQRSYRSAAHTEQP